MMETPSSNLPEWGGGAMPRVYREGWTSTLGNMVWPGHTSPWNRPVQLSIQLELNLGQDSNFTVFTVRLDAQ